MSEPCWETAFDYLVPSLPPPPPPHPNPSPPLPPPPPSHRPTITTTTTTSSPPPFTPPPPSPPPPSPCPTSPPPLPSPSRHTDKMPYQSHLQWHKNPHNTYFENFQNILKTNQPTDNTIYISDSPSLKNVRINEEIQHKYFLNSGEEFLWVGLSVGLSVGWSVCLSVEKIKKAKFKLAVCGNYSSKQWISLIYKFIRLSTLCGYSKSRKLPR